MQTESLIKLLTETVKFYADENNYKNDQVKIDGGFQARHSLKLIKENEESIQSFENLYNEFENQVNEKTTPEELLRMINDLQK